MLILGNRNGAFIFENQTCNEEHEFDSYRTYRFALSKYASVPLGDCGVDDVNPPPDPKASPPCGGDIDIRYSTMLVTKQMSVYRKNWIEMLTDEGGIIGGE